MRIKLTPREHKLIKGLFAGLSVSIAMKQSGYTDSILSNQQVCNTVLTMLLDETEPPNETLIELFKEHLFTVATAKITDFVSFGPEGITMKKDFPKEKAFCIAELQMKDAESVTSIRLHDSLKAADLLLRYKEVL